MAQLVFCKNRGVMTKIKVSVVTPNYNGSSFLHSTIDSVIAQTFQDWEMIIVDDCSTDESVDIINKYMEKDNRIKLIQLSCNSGAAVARNTAIQNAQGRYIAFLDGDDLWMPKKLEVQTKFMLENDVSFSYMSYFKVDRDGRSLGMIDIPLRIDYEDLLKTCSIGCLTAMYDTSKLGKQTMPLIRKRQDYGLWLKIIKKSSEAYGINIPLASYRVHSDSISSNKISAAKYQWRIYRDIENIKFSRAIYYFACYMLLGSLKFKFPKLYAFFIKR